MTPKHTPGPWRWEFNAARKNISLTGGRPEYDLTVMDFERWGMHGATPRFMEPNQAGLNLMSRIGDRPDWIEPFPDRKHHAHWCANVSHPDARLIAAAPDLLDALGCMLHLCKMLKAPEGPVLEFARSAIAKATGEITT